MREGGLEPDGCHFRHPENARHIHENSGQNNTQLGKYEDVKGDGPSAVQTAPHLCPTCGCRIATAEITQGLHKINTRVCLNTLEIDVSLPEVVRKVASNWLSLPQPVQDGIKTMLEGCLFSVIAMKCRYIE